MATDAPANVEAGTFEFGPFRLDVATRALYRGAQFVPLTPKAAEILLLLVANAGRVVTREQLLERVWPGVIVEEGTITNNVSALRKALEAKEFGDDGPIATVSRRGYRFTAEVIPAKAVVPAKAGTQETTPAAPERGTILVADIENQTGDAVFDGTIRQALLLHLAQSPHLEVLSDRRVRSLLGHIGKPGAIVTGDMALEICQRTGAKAAINGSIFALGEDYVIGLQAIHGESGDLIVTEQARAHGKGEVLRALDQAAIGLRTKLGESMASIKSYWRPFHEVATASLEALKTYTLGLAEWQEHGENSGVPHLLRAIEIDPDFASAYIALSNCCNNLGLMREATRHMQTAYELRDRATERERHRIVAGYDDIVLGDCFRAIDAHRVWEKNYPRDPSASINLSALNAVVGQWEKALAAGQRGLALEVGYIALYNVAMSLLALGRHDEARASLEDAFVRGFDAPGLHLIAYHEAFLRGDAKAMQRHVDAVAGRGGDENYVIAAQADTEAFAGRHARARELTRRAVDSARKEGALEQAALLTAQAAVREAEIGETERARQGALAALEIKTGRYVFCWAAYALARCGDAAKASEVAKTLAREHTQTVVERYWIPCIHAAMSLHDERWNDAIEALEPARAVELGVCEPFPSGYMFPVWLRGLALLGAGREEEGRAELARIVERPGLIRNFVVYTMAQRLVE